VESDEALKFHRSTLYTSLVKKPSSLVSMPPRDRRIVCNLHACAAFIIIIIKWTHWHWSMDWVFSAAAHNVHFLRDVQPKFEKPKRGNGRRRRKPPLVWQSQMCDVLNNDFFKARSCNNKCTAENRPPPYRKICLEKL